MIEGETRDIARRGHFDLCRNGFVGRPCETALCVPARRADTGGCEFDCQFAGDRGFLSKADFLDARHRGADRVFCSQFAEGVSRGRICRPSPSRILESIVRRPYIIRDERTENALRMH